MNRLFNISQDEKNRILEMHSNKKNVISEQTPNSGGTSPRVASWYDDTVKKYLKLGYKEVNTITLPPGLYIQTLSGPVINVSKNDGSDTGYIVILQDGGIRGQKEYPVELKPDGTTILDGYSMSNSESMYNNPSNKSEGSVILKK